MDSVSVSWSNSSFWGSFWGQLEIEVLGGLFCAILFLFILLWFFRPKISIAKFICKMPSGGTDYYYFKFANASIFDGHDIKIELYQTKKIPMGNGHTNSSLKQLSLQNSEIMYIPRRPMFWENDPENKHCMIVRTTDNLDVIVQDESRTVLIRMLVKHGLTGLSSVFEQDYAHPEDIKQMKKFKPGSKFDVYS